MGSELAAGLNTGEVKLATGLESSRLVQDELVVQIHSHLGDWQHHRLLDGWYFKDKEHVP